MGRRAFLSLIGLLLPARAVAERPPLPVGPPIPAVPVGAGIPYDADHTCDKCGTFANIVRQNRNGWHTHQCPKCLREWWHADPRLAE